jgi:hypothetical protein
MAGKKRHKSKSKLKAEGTDLELTDFILQPHEEARITYEQLKSAMETLGVEPDTPDFYALLKSSGLHIEYWRRFERKNENK